MAKIPISAQALISFDAKVLLVSVQSNNTGQYLLGRADNRAIGALKLVEKTKQPKETHSLLFCILEVRNEPNIPSY
ncbi:hypothetical protein GCM10011356_11750 [Kangiella profundi]|nr:hypothetical protein GCM10011356_11750 [Kangiella profundi]